MKSKILLLLILICGITISCVSAEVMINYTMFTPTASSDQGALYTPIKAIDENIATSWQSGTHAPGVWWQADFGTPRYIDSYNITPTIGFASLYSPRDWWLSGSTDGSTWYVVDNRTSVTSWVDQVNKTFNLQTNKSSYRYFKYQFVAGNYPSMGTMYLYNGGGGSTDTTPPDSITGLTNTTALCTEITWQWTNPGGSLNADYSHLYTLKNDVWTGNYSNSTSAATWATLSPLTSYAFSSKTVDLKGNINATWVNRTTTTPDCPGAGRSRMQSINHTLGSVPGYALVTLTKPGELFSVSNLTALSFDLTITNAVTGVAGTNQTIYWCVGS